MPPYRAPAVPLTKRPEDANATFAQRLKDYGIDIANAVIGAGEGLVGLADIPTFGTAGKALHDLTGYDPGLTRKILTEGYSEERQFEQQETSRRFREQGFFSGLGYAMANPAVPLGTITESLPLMVGGRGLAQGAVKLAPRLSGAVAGGLGEGLITAASQLEQIRQESPDQRLDAKGYGLGLLSGAGTAAIGYGAGKLAGKLGIADIDIPNQPVAEGITEGARKSLLRRLGEGALTEGLLEELPQSVQEQVAVNLATGKPWNEGINEAAGLGLLTGAAMGGAVQVAEGVKFKALNTLVQHEKIDAESRKAAEEEADKVAATHSAALSSHQAGVVEGKASLSLVEDATSLDERERDQKIEVATKAGQAAAAQTAAEAQGLHELVDNELQASGEAEQAAVLESNLAPLRSTVGAGEEFTAMVVNLANNSRNLSDFTKQMGTIYGQKGINAAAKAWAVVQQSVADITRSVSEAVRMHTEGSQLKELLAANKTLTLPADQSSKIVEGSKQFISASKPIKSGKYALADGTVITVEGIPREVSISELNDPEAWARGEGYASLQDAFEKTKYSRIKAFISGTGTLNIGKITHVDTTESIGAKRQAILASTSKARTKMAAKDTPLTGYQGGGKEVVQSENFDADRYQFLDANGKHIDNDEILAYRVQEIENEQGQPDEKLVMVGLTLRSGEELAPALVTRYDLKRHLRAKRDQSRTGEDIRVRIEKHKAMQRDYLATENVFPPADEEAAIARRADEAESIRKEILGIAETQADQSVSLEDFETFDGILTGIDALRQEEEAIPWEDEEDADTETREEIMRSPEYLAFKKAFLRFKLLKKQRKADVEAGLSLRDRDKIRGLVKVMNNNPLLRLGYSEYIAGLMEQAATRFTVESIVDFIKQEEGDRRNGVPLKSIAELVGVPDSLEDILVFMHESEQTEEETEEAIDENTPKTLFGQSLGALPKGQQTLTEQVLQEALPSLTAFEPEQLPVIRRKVQRKEAKEAVKQDFYDIFRKLGVLKNQILTDETVIAGFYRALGKLANEGYSAKAGVFDALRVARAMHADPSVSDAFKFEKQIKQVTGKMVGQERSYQDQIELVKTLWRETSLKGGFWDPSTKTESDYDQLNAEIIDILKDAGGMQTQDIDADLRHLAIIETETQKSGWRNTLNLSGSRYWTLEAVGQVTYQTRQGKKTIENPNQDELDLIAQTDPNYTVDKVRGFTYSGNKRADLPYVKKNEIRGEIDKIIAENPGIGLTVSDKSTAAQGESKLVHALVTKEDGSKSEPINMTVADVIRHRRKFGENSVQVAQSGQPALYPIRIKLAKPGADGKRWQGKTLRPDQLNALIQKVGVSNVVFVKPGMDPKRAEDLLKDKPFGLVIRSQLPEHQVFGFTQSTTMEPLIEEALIISAGFKAMTEQDGKPRQPIVTKAEVDTYADRRELLGLVNAQLAAVKEGDKKLESPEGKQLESVKKALVKHVESFETKLKAGLLAQKMRGRLISDPDFFEKVAKKYPVKGWTAKNYFDLFSKSGDYWSFVAQVRKLNQESTEKRIKHDFSPNNPLSPADIAKNYARRIVSFESWNSLDAVRDGSKPIESIEDASLRRAIGVALRTEEIYRAWLEKAKNDKDAADKALTEIVEVKTEASLPIDSAEIFEANRPAKEGTARNSFEQELIDANPQLRIGRMRDVKAAAFYKAVTKIFGADLVIVSGQGYRSRYISKASDGRAKIVINIDSPTAFHRIYGHEIFHHVVWKSSKLEYKAFRDAVMETLGEEAFYQAVDRVHAIRRKSKEIRIPEGTRNSVSYLLGQLKERGISEEEFMAELMASVVHEQGFYAALSKTFQGQTLAQKIIKWLIDRVALVVEAVNGHREGWGYAHGLMIGLERQQKLNELFASFIGKVVNNPEPDGLAVERFDTPFGRVSVEEIQSLAKNGQGWLQGFWKRIFPEGTKSRKTIMNGLENLLRSVKDWIIKHKPRMFFADLGADPKVVDMMKLIVFGQNKFARTVDHTMRRKGYHKLFQQMSTEDQIRFHDIYVRGLAVFYTYNLDGKEHKALRKSEVPAGASGIRRHVSQGEPADITADNAKDIAARFGFDPKVIDALKDFREVADVAYAELEKVAPGLKRRKNAKRESVHYGQSIRWHKKYGTDVDFSEAWDAPHDSSRLEGKKQFLQEKAVDQTTEDIMQKHGLEYDTINPLELLLNYTKDAYKYATFHRVLQRALKHDYAKIFTSQGQAMYAGYHPVDDNALRIMQDLSLPSGYKIKTGVDEDGKDIFYSYKNRDGEGNLISSQTAIFSTMEEAEQTLASLGKTAELIEVPVDRQAKISKYRLAVRYRDGSIGRLHGVNAFAMNKKAEADQALIVHKQDLAENGAQSMIYKQNKENIEWKDVEALVLETELTAGEGAPVARIYFQKDMARMLNTILAPDRIRRTGAGRFAMNIKNQLTNIEFALSMFHAMTIGQELVSSNSTWTIMRQRQNKEKVSLGKTLKGYAPWTAVREAKEIAALMEAVLADRELAKHPATIAKAKELFQTDSADVLDAVVQFYDAGGLLGLDKGLHSELQKQGEMRYKDGEAEVKIVDGKLVINLPKGDPMPLPLRFLGKHAPISRKAISESMRDVLELQMKEHPNSKLTAYAMAGKFALLEGTTAWLMEQGIPRIKMAMWAREYTLELDRNRAKIDAGQMTRSQIAYDVMKFIEDRFGEVNWQNLWLEPTYKTALQFLFRSFTWFTGSWKAAGKSGFDLVKWGWLKVKGEEVELTTKGMWGLNALVAHMMMVGLIYSAYMLQSGGGDDEVEDDETPLLTKMLFPRVDVSDPEKRVAIPSYVTEWYKMARHLGIIGHELEPSKLISGRFNSILGKSIDVFWNNQDFRGVTIRDADDNLAKQTFDALVYLMPVPISMSSAMKYRQSKGFEAFDMAISAFGITDAPAAAKRSEAANLAFEIRRREYKGKEISREEMELKDEVKRAAYAYGKGDKEQLQTMLAEKKISRKQFDNALARLPMINGRKNPRYIDPLTSALKGLTINGAIEVWGQMSPEEKKTHRRAIMDKYHNMLQRGQQSPEYKQEVFKQMREAGILGR